MSFRCVVCKINDVRSEGGVCSSCNSAADPFAVAAGVSPEEVNPRPAQDAGLSSPRRVLDDRTDDARVMRATPRVILDGSSDGAIDSGINKLSPGVVAIMNGVASSSAGSLQCAASSNPAMSVAQTQSLSTNSTGSSGYSSASGGSSIYVKGIAKNVVQDTDRRGVVYRWFRSLFKGSNFALDPDITEFQLYPDFSGQTINSSGTLADQVVIYGKIKFGMISENNDVEVFGHRDADGNIVAESVKNVATGAVAKPAMVLSRGVVVVSTLVLVALMVAALVCWGPGFYLSLACLILFIVFLPLIIKFFVWLLALIIMKA